MFDTGATHLGLPSATIRQRRLPLERTVHIETAIGPSMAKVHAPDDTGDTHFMA